MVDSHTQTEDIFFKMHWSFFIGSFHIITAKNTNTNVLNKTSTVTDYIFQKYGSINIKRIKSYKNPLDNDLYNTNFNYENLNNIEILACLIYRKLILKTKVKIVVLIIHSNL